MAVLDLFAGVGWGIGSRELGLEEEGVEIMPEAVATRDAVGLKTVHDDVWTYDYQRGAHEGHIASPPCQTFSTAGKGAGRKALDDVLAAIAAGNWWDIDQLQWLAKFTDPRTALVLVPLHAWYVERPEWVAWEQVPTVQPVWDACAEVMRKAGYSVWTGRLQAEQYGVPQTRKRSILIASRVREVKAPVPTHSRYYSRTPAKLDDGVEKWMSMAEALGWDADAAVVSNYGSGGDSSNRGVRRGDEPFATVASKVGRNIVYRSTTMKNSARRPLDAPALTVAFGHDANSARWVVRTSMGTPKIDGRNGTHEMDPFNRPAHTVTTKAGEWVSTPPDDTSVRVQVHEAGLLQAFPADMPWQGTKTKQYLQVGNAVPPGLAIPVLGEAAGIDWEEVNANYRMKVYGHE